MRDAKEKHTPQGWLLLLAIIVAMGATAPATTTPEMHQAIAQSAPESAAVQNDHAAANTPQSAAAPAAERALQPSSARTGAMSRIERRLARDKEVFWRTFWLALAAALASLSMPAPPRLRAALSLLAFSNVAVLSAVLHYRHPLMLAVPGAGSPGLAWMLGICYWSSLAAVAAVLAAPNWPRPWNVARRLGLLTLGAILFGAPYLPVLGVIVAVSVFRLWRRLRLLAHLRGLGYDWVTLDDCYLLAWSDDFAPGTMPRLEEIATSPLYQPYAESLVRISRLYKLIFLERSLR